MNARAQQSTANFPDDPIPEAQVLARWPVLSAAGLRRARLEGKIGWVRGKRGSAWFRPTAVQAYIHDFLENEPSCHVSERPHSLNSAASGSRAAQIRPASTDIGLSPEAIEQAALAFARKI